MIALDYSLKAEWEAATSFNVHDRNMLWGNYSFYAVKDDKERMERQERLIRSVLAKIRLGQSVNLREEQKQFLTDNPIEEKRER